MSETDSVDDILAHYGVPGMRWGRHKVSEAIGKSQKQAFLNPEPLSVAVGTPRKPIQVSGGKNHGPVDEALKTAGTVHLAKTSGIHAIPTKDLNEAVKRIKAEQAFAAAITPKPSNWQAAKEFVRSVITDQAKSEVRSLAKGERGPAMKYLDASLATKTAKHRTGPTVSIKAPRVKLKVPKILKR